MITGIYIGTERLSLFQDENIRIKSSIAKISDITKIFTDTSNSFTVPANENNNKIFKHWYESDLINGFDARKKIPAVIELGGINFKVGKIRLNKVALKSNKPSSYSIVFFGNLVDLKDILQDDKLTDLDLSAYDFVFTQSTVKSKLESPQDLCFSLLSKKRLFSNTLTSDGIDITDISASIKQVRIIDAIINKYNIFFSTDFFNSYDFYNTYLTLSATGSTKTAVQIPLATAEGATDPTVNGNIMLATGFGSSFDRATVSISMRVNIATGYENVPYNIFIKNGDEIVGRKDNLTGSFFSFADFVVEQASLDVPLENVTFWIESEQSIVFNADMRRNFSFVVGFSRYQYDSGLITTTTNFNVSKSLPDIKIIDYLSGLFKMFKLVAIPQKSGIIFIDTLVNYYKNGTIYDLTKYIDFKSHTVNSGTLLNEIKYQFEEPQTILNKQFKKNNSVGYGDLEAIIKDDNGKQIDGKKLDFKVPFEQIVYERISETDLQYGLLLDENLEEVTIKPHIHYVQTISQTIKLNSDTGGGQVDVVSVNVPSHYLDFNLQAFSTTFGNEFSTYNGQLISNTLYSNYHKDYIDRIFNIRKREYNFKAIEVPEYIVLNLGLNDVIQIKEKFFRIETIETNTLNNNINLKLINDTVVDLQPVTPFTADNITITADNTTITADNNIL